MAEEGAPLGQLGTLRFAQASGGAGHQVVCQAMPTRGQIVRVVQFEGKCFRETFSPFVGKVEKRESVPCNTTCPATHKG